MDVWTPQAVEKGTRLNWERPVPNPYVATLDFGGPLTNSARKWAHQKEIYVCLKSPKNQTFEKCPNMEVSKKNGTPKSSILG